MRHSLALSDHKMWIFFAKLSFDFFMKKFGNGQ